MAKKKPASLVNGNDFAKVYLRYGLERLVEEGHYSTSELSSLDNGGEYTKKLLGDAAFRKRLEEAEAGVKDGKGRASRKE